MNAKRQKKALLLIVESLFISACGMVQLFGPTPTPTPTNTPTNTPTPTSTPTPLYTSTPTSTPTPTPIPGWKKFEGSFEGGGVQIWLPESYEGGDVANDMAVIVKGLRSLGPAYDQMAETIQQNPTAFVLLIFNLKQNSDGRSDEVVVAEEQVLSVISPEFYINAVTAQLPPNFIVSGKNIVQLDAYKAGQLVLQAEIKHIKVTEAIYFIKDKNLMWSIAYSTSTDGFEKELPIFEQSVNTFRVNP